MNKKILIVTILFILITLTSLRADQVLNMVFYERLKDRNEAIQTLCEKWITESDDLDQSFTDFMDKETSLYRWIVCTGNNEQTNVLYLSRLDKRDDKRDFPTKVATLFLEDNGFNFSAWKMIKGRTFQMHDE